MTQRQPRSYGGASATERRSRRRASLLEATLDIVATGGVYALGVKAISNAAQLNDRYFYEHFADCDEALAALYDELITQAAVTFAEAIANSEPEAHARLHACVTAGVDFVMSDPRRARLLVESQATDQLRTKRQQLVMMLAEVMLSGRSLLGPDAPNEQDARLIALTVVSGGLDLATMWLAGDVAIERGHFIDFMTALILSAAHLPPVFRGDLDSSAGHYPGGD